MVSLGNAHQCAPARTEVPEMSEADDLAADLSQLRASWVELSGELMWDRS